MTRNRNIDIVRAVALILVLIYHCWVKMGAVPIGYTPLQIIISLGGEIGVTAFFVLSGYGIYMSLYRNEKVEEIAFLPFMKKRLHRILPQYYLNLWVALFFTNAAVYFSLQYLPNILSHIFLMHNFIMNYAGAINGVLWTMAVTFQFYLLAIPCYKLLNKFGIICVPLSIIVTVLFKMVAFHCVLKTHHGMPDFAVYSFWLGRQIIVADLDNFIIGMGVAFYTLNYKEISKRWIATLGCVASLIVLYFVCKAGVCYGIHTDNLSGYFWHSGVAVCIGFSMLFAYYVKGENKGIVSKILLWLSKYEYGIYLWHLIIIDNLLQCSSMIQNMLENRKYFSTGILFVVISVGTGVMFTKMTE